METKYIYHHLGLGDHIICNGLIRNLINYDDKYFMFIKQHNLVSVKFMFRDLKNIDYIVVEDDNSVTSFISDNKILKKDIIFIGFGRHPLSKEFDDSFYLQHGIEFKKRWSDFKLERDLESEISLFKKYNVVEGEYIFIHDDHSRNLHIDESFIVNKTLPKIRPLKNYTDNIIYIINLDTGAQDYFEVREAQGQVMSEPGFKGNKPLNVSKNLLVFYFE